MKLTIYRKKLIEALEACQRARASWNWCHSRQINHAFSCYIFRTEASGFVDIITTNTEWCIKKSFHANITDFEKRTFAIPADRLVAVLKSLDDEYVTIQILHTQIRIMHACGEFSLPMVGNPEEVIQMTDDLLGMRTDISVKGVEIPFLSSTIKRCINFVSQDELRPVISGVCINSTENHTDIVSSDGHKLMRIRRKPICETPFQTIIPAETAKHLPKLLPNTGDVDLFIQPYSDKKDAPEPVCIIKTLDTEIAVKTVDRRYPNYNLVIPPSVKYEAKVSKNLLTKTIKRINMLSPFVKADVDITFEPNLMKAKYQEGDIAEEYEVKETVACQYSGEKMEIRLRIHLLQSCIRNIATSNVRIGLNSPNDAAIIMPDPPAVDEELITLSMPLYKGEC